MTRDELKRLGYVEQPDGSFSRVPLLGRVVADQRGQQARSLVEATPQSDRSERPVARRDAIRRAASQWSAQTPVVRVTLISLRSRRLDDDNLTGGFKPLRDAIAASLGVDDGSGLVEWQCRQIQSDTAGTIVMIESL